MEFARAWHANWVWLISRTPGLRELVEFGLARGAFDYRRTTW